MDTVLNCVIGLVSLFSLAAGKLSIHPMTCQSEDVHFCVSPWVAPFHVPIFIFSFIFLINLLKFALSASRIRRRVREGEEIVLTLEESRIKT